MHIHLVLPGKIAFGETQIMNGIQQIGFAHTISAANANNALGKNKLLVEVVFELEQRYGIQSKAQ
jgi:hypothetical protein